MKKRKLKVFVVPMVYGIAFVVLFMSLIIIDTSNNNELALAEDYTYVNSSIISNNISVVSEEETIFKPYNSENVQISKNFYDVDSSDEEKENSIIYYNDTYIQNSGILYKSDDSFDVVAILDGTVVDVKTDDILGNVVEVKHSNNLISTYEGLSTVNVKKDQLLNQGDVIGKSGKLQLGESLENALLFELVSDGKYVNPLNYFDKKINEL